MGTLYTLEEMTERLLNLSDEEWGAYAFGREPLRDRVGMEERLYLAKEAAECAKKEAEAVKEQYPENTIDAFIRAHGLKVHETQKANDGGYVIFAQYKPLKDISIFTHSIGQAEAYLKECRGLPFENAETIKKVLLAHEIFHYIEETKKDAIFTRRKHINLWRIGPVKYSSALACLSELGGMAFAKKLCGISWSPYLLDVFLVYGYSPEAASNLFEGILKAAKGQAAE